jgi:hypothetical protein
MDNVPAAHAGITNSLPNTLDKHTYRPKEFQSWVIYNISQNRHDINKTRMFTLQNTSPEVTTRTPSKPYLP